MRIVQVAFAVLVVAASAQGQPSSDAVLVGYLRDLAGRAALKTDNLEVAAFLVVDGKGELACRMWPPTARRASERYDGVIPDGTIAIAHSHPYEMPRPSRDDIALSKALGLPIYVVSRWEVHVVDPQSGKDVTLLRGQSWTRAPAVNHCN